MGIIGRILCVGGLVVFLLASLHNSFILNRFWPDYQHFKYILGGLLVAMIGAILLEASEGKQT